jgi:hypothetical protein
MIVTSGRSFGGVDGRGGCYLNDFVTRLLNLCVSRLRSLVEYLPRAEELLVAVAPAFGYNPADTTAYNTKYRNVVLASLSAERLLMIYGKSGIQGVTAEVKKLRQQGII